MGLKIVVGGGVLDAPDWYENYRTFAIYCAVGRPALWPPQGLTTAEGLRIAAVGAACPTPRGAVKTAPYKAPVNVSP